MQYMTHLSMRSHWCLITTTGYVFTSSVPARQPMYSYSHPPQRVADPHCRYLHWAGIYPPSFAPGFRRTAYPSTSWSTSTCWRTPSRWVESQSRPRDLGIDWNIQHHSPLVQSSPVAVWRCEVWEQPFVSSFLCTVPRLPHIAHECNSSGSSQCRRTRGI